MPKLSIVTITFNNYQELLQTLKSIETIDAEKVIINGGACKATKGFLDQSSFKAISEKDNGIADAFNKGLNHSTGDFVTFLNSGDSLMDQEYYNNVIHLLDDNKNLDFVYADLALIDQYAGEIRVRSNRSLPCMPFLHPTLVVRRSVFEKIGQFDQQFKIAMDLDFVYRMVRNGAVGHYIPQMVVKMDGRGVSSTQHSKHFMEVLRVILKNKDFTLTSLSYLLRRLILLAVKAVLLGFGGELLMKAYRRFRYRKN